MSERGVRVNELIRREISLLLHTRYKDQSVGITITGVDVAPDLRQARIAYSVLGDEEAVRLAGRFLEKNKESLRRAVGKAVVLKYLPHFRFYYDESLGRGARVMELLDEIDQETGTDDPDGDRV